MTLSTLVRCRTCGRHQPADRFGQRRRTCRDCVNTARRDKRVRECLSAPATPAGGGAAQDRPGLPEGRPDALWHQCDGANVHPDHVAAHVAGFWTEGHLPSRFIRRFCCFPDGPRHGEPAEIMPHMEEMLLELYRLRPDGLRQYRVALLGFPKKNSKSTILGWLALYHTVADPRSGGPPDNVCAASAEDQANIVFGLASTTCELGAGARHAQPGHDLDALTERWESEILVPSTPRARLRRLAAGGGTLDGPNLYFRGLDELHEWTTPKQVRTFKILRQGGALRRQPLMICITTAGWDRDSLAYELYAHGQACIANPATDPTFLFYWWQAREVSDGTWAGKGPHEAAKAGDPLDYRAQEYFYSANPSAGTLVQYDDYLADCRFAVNTEADQRRYRGNEWVEAEDLWLPQGALQACRRPEAPALVPEARNVAAVDASTKYDSTAIVAMSAVGEGSEMRVRQHARIWQRPIDPASGQLRENWLIPIDEVTWHLHSLHRGTAHEDEEWCDGGVCRCCGLAVPEALRLEAIGFDPAYVTWAAASWENSGLPVEEVPQSNARMVPATTALYELIVAGRLEYGADRLIERHYKAARAKLVSGAGERLVKRKGGRRYIDGAIAAVMCVYLLSQPRAREVGWEWI